MMGEIICKNIDGVLLKIGKTRAKLLHDCELHESTLRQWKRGSTPSAVTLYKVARYLNTSVEYLLTGINDNELVVADSATTDYISKELPEDSKKLLEDFDKLNARDRNLILTMCHSLACSKE